MGSGKLLLLAAGSFVAGVVAAGLTTHSIQSYRHAQALASQVYPAPDKVRFAPQDDNRRSWLDRGLSALDIPASPFGRDEWDGSDGEAAPPQDYGYLPPQEPSPRSEAPARPAVSQDDAAADAAARAGDAAQDVIVAERSGDLRSRTPSQ